jgi:hypothetical protein
MPDVFSIIGSRMCCHSGLNRQTVVVLADLVTGHRISKLSTIGHCARSVRLHNAYANLEYFGRTGIVGFVPDVEIW